jgi:hypothetical protein
MRIRSAPETARILVVFAAIVVAPIAVGIGATNKLFVTFAVAAVAAAAGERPRYYTRREAVEYLRSRGFPITASTLTKKCALGLGPRATARWSQRHLYLAEDLDTWAESFIQPVPANSPAATPPAPIATGEATPAVKMAQHAAGVETPRRGRVRKSVPIAASPAPIATSVPAE